MEYPRVAANSDGAGVVDEVDPGVSRHWLGKRVWLYNGQRNGRRRPNRMTRTGAIS
jgi:NADPH2:quinone reductase